MKKIILLFIMVFAVAGMQAKESTKIYATFGECTSSTYSDGTYSWTADQNRMWLFLPTSGLNLDVTKYQKLHVKVTDKAAGGSTGFKIRVFTGSAFSTPTSEFDYYSSTEVDVDLTSVSGTINRIDIRGLGTSGFKINATDVYLWGTYETMDITTTITSSSDKDSPFAWSATGTLSPITNNLSKTGSSVIFGYANNNDDAHGSFNVAGYDNVTVNLNAFDSEKNASVRLLKGTGTSNVEFSTASGTLSYTKPLTFSTCASIKAGAGASNCQDVSSIVFTKEFSATSTTDFNIAASSSSTVNYDRTFPTDKKSTVCLPFALTADEVTAAGKFYELSSADGTTLYFTQVSTTEAYKPYVFEAATATPFASLTNKAIVASAGATTSYPVGDYTFHGTLVHQNVPNGAYGYNASTGAFSKATSTEVTIDAFRGYITSTSSARSLDLDFGDGTTGIEKVKNVGNKYDSIYNLSGQSVSPNYKGIVIKNGKKMIQK